MTSMMETMMGKNDGEKHGNDKIYSRAIMGDMLETLSSKVQTNNLKEFKKFVENGDSDIKNYINAIQYGYNLDLNIYKEEDGSVYIYYASSDTRLHVATSTIDRLLDYAFHTPTDPLRSADCVKQRCELIDRNLAFLRKEQEK